MTRRLFLATSSVAAASAATARRPNIVLILADDMGFSDLASYGSEIRTPHTDALAKRGIRFTQFYNTARCCPTRASLLTGLYAHQAGVGHMVADWGHPGYRGTIGPNTVTIAEVLGSAGYRCYGAGKWHVANQNTKENWPLQRGFHRYFGTLAGGGNYFHPSGMIDGNEPAEPGENFFYTDVIADRAVSFLDQHKREHPEKPFFLYVPFTAPHWPLQALEPDIARYRDTYRRGWDSARSARHRRQLELGIVQERWGLSPRDEKVPEWSIAPDKEWESERMAVFAAQIDKLDQAVGRIVEQIQKIVAEEDTLILFVADNGASAEDLRSVPAAYRVPFEMKPGNDPTIKPGPRDTYQSCGPAWAQVSNAPFRRYKMSVHEGGISTPMIAAWGKKVTRPGTLNQTPGHVVDLMPTCLEAAGVSYPRNFQGREITQMAGRSFLPALSGKPTQDHRNLFFEHQGNQAIRSGPWKLVRAHGQGWELYNLASDRTELKNLSAADPRRVRQLTAEFQRWMEMAQVLPWEQARPKQQ